MNRVSIVKGTGELIEIQSGGWSEDSKLADSRLNTLKQNALNLGYVEEDIEVKWMTDKDTKKITKKTSMSTEAIIQQEIRDIAIKSLKQKGKMPKE